MKLVNCDNQLFYFIKAIKSCVIASHFQNMVSTVASMAYLFYDKNKHLGIWCESADRFNEIATINFSIVVDWKSDKIYNY